MIVYFGVYIINGYRLELSDSWLLCLPAQELLQSAIAPVFQANATAPLAALQAFQLGALIRPFIALVAATDPQSAESGEPKRLTFKLTFKQPKRLLLHQQLDLGLLLHDAQYWIFDFRLAHDICP